MGHVPTGEVSAARSSADVPRREYRRAGARYPSLTRRRIGELGEGIAAAFLARNGLTIIGRNVHVGRGEIDILANDRGHKVVIEVKAAVVDGRDIDPLDAFDERKEAQVWSLADAVGSTRVDVVTVAFLPEGVQVRWIPEV